MTHDSYQGSLRIFFATCVAWDVLQAAFFWNQNVKRDTHLKNHRVCKLYFWPPLYTQLTAFLFELYASSPSSRYSLWNITTCTIKLFIVTTLPSIFQPPYTDHISVPCSQYIIYLVVQVTLFLGRSSLFPKSHQEVHIYYLPAWYSTLTMWYMLVQWVRNYTENLKMDIPHRLTLP